jgi:hypothetical protein
VRPLRLLSAAFSKAFPRPRYPVTLPCFARCTPRRPFSALNARSRFHLSRFASFQRYG